MAGSPYGVGYNLKTKQVYVALSNKQVAIISGGNGKPYKVIEYLPVDGFAWGVTCGNSADDNWVTDNTGGNLFKINSKNELAATIELGTSAHPYGCLLYTSPSPRD